ncbi:MAG: UDP-3-O-acyl-N-acetylglucosamine deacetylase [Desulfobacterales bacterium]
MLCHQRTLMKSVSCNGIGVHSGKKVHLKIHPAKENHGIKFKRTDIAESPSIPAIFSRVVDTSLATVIGQDGCIVSTIEHLMASFSGLSIDNALVELDSYELPIMDGSAGPFTRLIKSAGFKRQKAPRFYFVAKAPVIIEENGKSVAIYPSSERRITYTISFDHPLVKTQSHTILLSEDVFEHEISPARTFGFYHEIEYLKKFGLARGGSLDNAVVLDQEKILNPGGLRYSDEFVRHKILDCIGDFSLLGMPILGHIKVYKSGHAFNHEFLKNFLTQKNSWQTCCL